MFQATYKVPATADAVEYAILKLYQMYRRKPEMLIVHPSTRDIIELGEGLEDGSLSTLHPNGDYFIPIQESTSVAQWEILVLSCPEPACAVHLDTISLEPPSVEEGEGVIPFSGGPRQSPGVEIIPGTRYNPQPYDPRRGFLPPTIRHLSLA